MGLPESDVHSFIVKLWFEQSAEDPKHTDWHGHITHVPGGERRYLQELDDIGAFIEPYLRAAGVAPKPRARFKRWLRLKF
jgi:hypothetical protein